MIYRLHDAWPPDDNDEGGDETSQCHESAEDAKSDDATCEWNWERKNWGHFSLESWSNFRRKLELERALDWDRWAEPASGFH